MIDTSALTRRRFRELQFAGFLLLFFGVFGASPVSAQDVQVPFDRDSTLYAIDSDLRAELNLFPEVSGFQKAELYQSDSTTYELVLRYRKDGRLRRDRRPLSTKEVASLRQKIARRESTGAEERALTQAGRYDLIAGTTLHGVVEGSLVAGAVGVNGEDILTLPLLGGTVGFFVPLLATRKARVTEAEADMAFYGGIQGYIHAVQLTQILGDGKIDGRTTAGLAAVAGPVEGLLAYRIARTGNWSSGHGEMVLYNGLAGNLVGGGMGSIVTGDDQSSRLVAGTSLLGSLGGAYIGHRLGQTDRYTNGDARVYIQSSALSLYVMASIFGPREDSSVRTGASLLTGSAIGGALLGRQLVQNRDFTGTQSGLLGLGAVAGGLFGGALTLEANENTSRIAGAIGSAVGFGLTYVVLQGDARKQASTGSSTLDLDVHVTPTMASGPQTGSSNEIIPQVSLTASF